MSPKYDLARAVFRRVFVSIATEDAVAFPRAASSPPSRCPCCGLASGMAAKIEGGQFVKR